MAANFFAWFTLSAWPLVVLSVYASRRAGVDLARTTAWMAVLPVMFLPPEITLDLPGFSLNKQRIAFISIWAALQLFCRDELRAGTRSITFPRLVLAALVLGTIQTARTNGDPLTYGHLVLPGLGPRDAFVMALAVFLDGYVPFVVGATVFRSERALKALFDVLVLCALIYLPFHLIELRLSPQFNYWVYGFTAGSFIETRRLGGWRPTVFMSHGLGLAMFYFAAFSASLALSRARVPVTTLSSRSRTLLTGMLVILGKSLGPAVFALVALADRLSSSARRTSGLAVVMATMAIGYPIARSANLFPTETLVQVVSRIDGERADSLAFRFRHEDALIERASSRPLFGWGYWSRGFIYSEEGQYESVTDGFWIIRLASYGWVGAGGFLALLIVPVFRFWRRRASLCPTTQILGSSLALLVASIALDQLPNAMADHLPMCYAGALLGLSQGKRARTATPIEVGPASQSPNCRAAHH